MPDFRLNLFLPFLLLSLLLSPTALAQTQHTGQINGAQYIIDVPTETSGDVLLIARGFRPDFFPLSPVYEQETAFYQTLLAEGWIIGSTSFRSNRWVVAEGGADILALREFIHNEIHPIKRAIVYGETMGGGVAVWLAENRPEAFSGIFALGADLYSRAPSGEPDTNEIAGIFSARPQLPILFAANGDEIASSLSYQARVAEDTPYKPVTWQVDRAGHVNVNSAERLSAMRALLNWIDGKGITSREDATIKMSPPSSAALVKQIGAGNIRRIRPLYGNLYTSFVASDMQKLGIGMGDQFKLVHRQVEHAVTFASSYSDVPHLAWVAFIDPEGYVQISRNYANAAQTLSANSGDAILLMQK